MSKKLRKVASFTIRWGIAVVGIWLVVSKMSMDDRTLVADARLRPQSMIVVRQTASGAYLLEDPHTGRTQEYPVDQLLSKPDREKVKVKEDDGRLHEVSLLAIETAGDNERQPTTRYLIVADSPDGPGREITPDKVGGGFAIEMPYPRVEKGIRRMIRDSNPWLLVLAVVIFPLTIVLTSFRWQRLLEALSIHMSLWQVNVLNMVGLFYNTCVPMGSSGGDLLKAYYVSQHTPFKTRAVLSVIIDRVIGLIVLIIVGSTIACVFWFEAGDRSDRAVQACGKVALVGAIVLAGTALALLVAFQPSVKGMLQSERVLSRLPMRAQIEGAFEVMGIYRQRLGLILFAMVLTVPVHLNVVVSALLAGKAMDLPISSAYYFVIVPVTVLAGAIPVSPQGIGVMEVTAYVLMSHMSLRQITGQDVLALTMSIRVVQMFWNMFGGIFVITGHYRPPSQDKDNESGEPASTATGP
jgi:glycosyltransferase 2 family protein